MPAAPAPGITGGATAVGTRGVGRPRCCAPSPSSRKFERPGLTRPVTLPCLSAHEPASGAAAGGGDGSAAASHLDFAFRPAAAWNLVMNQATAAYSARLPPRGVAELFASCIPSITGALHPPAKAVRTDGGWRITGQ